MSDFDKTPDLPVGTDFMQVVRGQEDACDGVTRQRLPFMGQKAPALVSELGTLLSWLDRAGSCWWGCAKGDHLVEHAVGGSCGTTRAGLRLAYLGFYDEALSLSRFVGERANLLALFRTQPVSMERWRQADERTRRRDFSAVRVRIALEAIGAPIPTPEERYRQLSSFGSHPGRTPQHHDPRTRPRMGGIFDEAGFLLALNELARGLVLVAGLAAPLLAEVPQEQITSAALAAAEQIGGVNVADIDGLWDAAAASADRNERS
ncbi:hypothetical protein E0H75_42280 [Kribbella capetownensis]|uniref:Uncharacterized protein n=1 Tax=Kribbella capetownensis TaxID=1572659 RepID=A0A4R0IRD9_9ACTN|nr:hypothetical protein [Kribbella capetownensis]TCC33888.1 hypothetical protein E0H75_42280 [Kribbella capetownensis]